MDRQQARRQIMREMGEIELHRNALDATAQEADQAGDPIIAGELRRYVEKMTDLLDGMYKWAGNI